MIETETKTYAAMLYSIAEEIEVEGRLTAATVELNNWGAERIREAAQRMVDLLTLLSALESWGFSEGKRLPEYMLDRLLENVDALRKELLNDPAQDS